MNAPAELAEDLRLAESLEDLRQEDTQIVTTLISVYKRILVRVNPDVYPYLYADLQTSLGIAYYECSIGDHTAHLEQAIACYYQALRIWTPESTPFEYGRTQNNLGAAYSELPSEDHVTNLNKAIASYQQALRTWTIETAPLEYARAQYNLGAVYCALPTEDSAANQKRAISCYEQALRVWTSEAAPDDYAAVQHDLGAIYQTLPSGNHTTNLEHAIQCYQQALRFQTIEKTPLDYVTIQMNLGTTYRDLPTGDRATNLQRAMNCYQLCYDFWEIFQQSVYFFMSEDIPLSYATLQMNLGILYAELPTGDRTSNLNKAIECYQQALRFRTPEVDSLAYARTMHNLGNAYLSFPAGNHVKNFDKAIECYQQALRFLTIEEAPLYYAAVQDSLGIAYSELPTGDPQANLRDAINCYKQALNIRTPETTPLDYASTQNNLGLAYNKLQMGDRQSHLKLAIHCYRQSLRFWTSEIAPSECRMVLSNLGNLYFAEKMWEEALDTYLLAIRVGEELYRTGLLTESKVIENSKNSVLYHHAAFSAARCGKVAEALLILEHGKTRWLTEALRARVPRPPEIPDDTWLKFEQAQKAIYTEQQQRAAILKTTHNLAQEYTFYKDAMLEAHAILDRAIHQVRLYAPKFLQMTDLSTINTLPSDEYTALIAFCITDQGSMGFVVTHGDRTIQAVEAPQFTRTDLRHLFSEVDIYGQATSGWLLDYEHYVTNNTPKTFMAWKDKIDNTLSLLAKNLLAPILLALSSDTKKILFLPSAELFLLPLHAIPLLNGNQERLCNRYIVNYAPSVEVLLHAQANIPQETTSSLYAVINPTSDPRLIFSSIEGTAIARLFNHAQVNEGRDGTKQRLISEAPGHSYIHFSGHSSYHWDDPSQSGLELYDSRMTLMELQDDTAHLYPARLVTLSSCETGMIDIIKGNPEEYMGIPATFLLAGVPCVVSSLWVVPDFSTALLMEQMYTNHLKGGMNIPAALREAQLWVRELSIGDVTQYTQQWYDQSQQGSKELYKLLRHYRYQARQNPTSCPFEHPYYWAGFMVNGM